MFSSSTWICYYDHIFPWGLKICKTTHPESFSVMVIGRIRLLCMYLSVSFDHKFVVASFNTRTSKSLTGFCVFPKNWKSRVFFVCFLVFPQRSKSWEADYWWVVSPSEHMLSGRISKKGVLELGEIIPQQDFFHSMRVLFHIPWIKIWQIKENNLRMR